MTPPRIVYEDEHVTLWHGDYRDVIPRYAAADLIVTDPPYAETSLMWDRWPDGWPTDLAKLAASMWCFGSMRMFLDRRDEFAAGGWKLSQDVVWEKPNGSSSAADRFRRVHEHVAHWYRGAWSHQHHETPRDAWHGANNSRVLKRKAKPGQWGELGNRGYDNPDTRLARSVQRVANLHGQAIHPTEKPVGILQPLIEYACPPGGVVLDPFAGSASTLVAARECGRRAIGVEKREEYAKAAAKRLAQLPMPIEASS